MPIFWWMKRLPYVKFITRELTSIPVAYSALLLLTLVQVLFRGEASYDRFREILATPGVIVLHAVVLLFLLFHTFTWLNAAPRALVVRLGGRRVPEAAILAGHYAAWLVASAFVAWFLLGG